MFNDLMTIPEAKKYALDQHGAGIETAEILKSLVSKGVMSAGNTHALVYSTIQTLVGGVISGRLDPTNNSTAPTRAAKRKAIRKKDSELQDFAKRMHWILESTVTDDVQKIAEIKILLRKI